MTVAAIRRPATPAAAPERAAPVAPIQRRAQWLLAVAEDAELPAACTRLAVVLGNRFMNGSTGSCFPSQATIAERLGLSDRQVRTLIQALVVRGHLRVLRGATGRSSSYEMVLKAAVEEPVEAVDTGRNLPVRERDMPRDTGSFSSPNRKETSGQTGTELPPNPGIEPSPAEAGEETVNQRRAARARGAPLRPDDEITLVEHGACFVEAITRKPGVYILRSSYGGGYALNRDGVELAIQPGDYFRARLHEEPDGRLSARGATISRPEEE